MDHFTYKWLLTAINHVLIVYRTTVSTAILSWSITAKPWFDYWSLSPVILWFCCVCVCVCVCVWLFFWLRPVALQWFQAVNCKVPTVRLITWYQNINEPKKLVFTKWCTTSSQQNLIFFHFPGQGLVLSSLFWGYFASQIPGGYVSDVYGSEFVIFWSIFGCSICTVIVPLISVGFSLKLVVFSRICLGLSQGIVSCTYIWLKYCYSP